MTESGERRAKLRGAGKRRRPLCSFYDYFFFLLFLAVFFAAFFFLAAM